MAILAHTINLFYAIANKFAKFVVIKSNQYDSRRIISTSI
jgi:hypothetical protein